MAHRTTAHEWFGGPRKFLVDSGYWTTVSFEPWELVNYKMGDTVLGTTVKEKLQ